MTNNADFFVLELEQDDFQGLLNEDRKEKNFIDVQLKVGDKVYDAHRNVLSLNSPVLEKAILKQCSTTMTCSIIDKYVNPEIMEDLLNFLYTGYFKLTPDNAHSVCLAAHYLKVSTLLEPCVDYLCRLVAVENVLIFFQLSNSCQLDLLQRRCKRIIVNNFQTVLQSIQILQFSFKDFKDVIDELRETFWRPTLRIATFHCVVRWTESNLSERLEHLPILLEAIPLVQLPVEFLSETVSVHPLVKESLQCQQILLAAQKRIDLFKCSNSMNVMIVISKSSSSTCMNCFDPTTGIWKKLPNSLSPKSNFAATVFNNQNIIVCDKYVNRKNGQITNSVEMFDWNKQTWTKLPAMPFGLRSVSIAAHKDHLYVIGKNKKKPFLTSFCYSFKKKQWKEIKSCGDSSTMFYGHLISCNDYLYAIGGHSFKIVRYDPEHDEWTNMAEFEGSRVNDHYSVVSHRGKIYLSSTRQNFEVYDPEVNVLTPLPQPNFSYFKGLVSMNGQLLTVGKHGKSDNYYIHEFDLLNKRWIELEKTPLEHASCSATLITIGIDP